MAGSITIARLLLFGVAAAAVALPAQARTIAFGGLSWEVRANGAGGPGPNRWKAANAWLDDNGALHLKISHANGRWYCAELQTTEALGFGTYQFWLDTRVDDFDPNVVLGLFDYGLADGTDEIDIEFARWGNRKWPNGNYTVYPARAGRPYAHTSFEVANRSAQSTQRFVRSASAVGFQSLRGHRNGDRGLYHSWTFAPANPQARVPQAPLPVHLNLWLAKGHAPLDGREVEVVIRDFRFTPAPAAPAPPTP
jgi:hypothetical protein